MKKRLSAGQTAKSIALKKEQKRQMTQKKIRWVKSILDSRTSLPKDFKDITIKGLCDYASADNGLEKLNVNTFKTHTNSLYPGEEMLAQIKASLVTIKNKASGKKNISARSSKNTVKRLTERQKTMSLQITKLTDELLSLRYGYLRLLETLEDIPSKDVSIRDAIRAHRKVIDLHAVKED